MKRFAAAFAVSAMLCSASSSSGDVVNWGNSFVLQTSGAVENPLVRLGFNPQPEPPVDSPTMDVSDPFRALITVPEAGASGGSMRIIFGIQSPFGVDAPGEPTNDLFSFQLNGGTPETAYTAHMRMWTGSGGVPKSGSWVSFNPQPEPPFLGPGAGAIGFDFEFTQTSPGYLELQIFDATGAPLQFSQVAVAEPGSLASATMGLLIAGVVLCRRKRTRSKS